MSGDSVNASIPLQSNPAAQGFDVGKMMTLADMAQQMRQRQTAIQNQNALTQVLANPESYDPKGNITPNALRVVTAADPKVGMQMREDNISEQLRLSQEKHYETESGKQQFDFMSGIAGVGMDAYTEAKKRGASEQDAISAGKGAVNSAVDSSGGMLTPDQIQGIKSHPFDPVQVKAFASMNKDWLAGERAGQVAELGAKKEDLAERKETATEKQNQTRDSIMLEAVQNRGTDPKKDAYESFKREHPNATAEQLAQFVQTTGAAPRSPTAMAMRKFIEEHPDATSEDLEKFNADLRATATASSAFATGKQGQAVNSMNVATNHLQTLDELATALNNKDTRAFNQIGNAWAKQTGNPAPTNFEAAKTIVGDEVVKAIVGAGGTGADREKAQAAINAANSPAQLHGAIQTVYKLMGGQLKGLQLQYEQTTKKTDFLDRLSPEAKKALLGDDKDGKSDKDEHPPDIQAILEKYE
jgi:hypothetical protein